METKVCSFCGKSKPVSEFSKDYRYGDEIRYLSACKKCRHEKYYNVEKNREYRQKSVKKPNIKKRMREYFAQYRNGDKYKKYQKDYTRRDYVKKRTHERTTSQEYKDAKNQYRKDHYELVRGRERKREKEYNKKPEVRIKRALRARLLGILKRGKGSKSGKMVELVGCTMPFLRQYLESLWTGQMSWQNYGFGRGKWVMDHIVSCDKFDLTDKEQQRICFNYKNLQPLWWEDNAKKSNK